MAKGYATQEQQTEATKRYRKTEAGRIACAKARDKSGGKRFIQRYATLEDLEELKRWIAEKEESLMTMDQRIRKMVAENGEAYVLLTYRFTVPYKNRKDGVDAWESKETNLDPYTTEGPFLTEDAAINSFEPKVYKHTYNGSCLCFETARVVCVAECDLEEWGEDADAEIQVDLAMDGTDWLGREEAERFGKDW